MTTPAPLHKITAAVAFDDNLETIVNTATRLAQMCQAKLRLLHICDPWSQSVFASRLGGNTGELLEAIRSDNERAAKERLELLLSSLPDNVEAELAINHDETIAGILADTKNNPTGLLVVGAHHQLSHSPAGFSDAINVVIDSDTPTLIVHEDTHPQFLQERLRVGIADDFSAGGDSALQFASSLAASGAHCDFVQIHVQDGGELRTAMKEKPYGKEHDAAVVSARLGQVHDETAAKMAERNRSLKEVTLSTGGTVQTSLAFGNVGTEIDRSCNAFRSDFVIYGRHRMFHKENLVVGKVPFKAMLQQNRGIIITP